MIEWNAIRMRRRRITCLRGGRKRMTYEELVKQVKTIAAKADASKIPGHVAFQFNVEGEAEGAFYLEIADGKIHVEPYEYYDRDVLIRCTADTLLKIMDGKLDPVFAFTVQKIKVEGDLGKALLLKEVVGQKKAEMKAAKKAAKKTAKKI